MGSSGEPGNGDSEYAWLSSDGRYLAFDSISNNLVPGDTNGKSDVFLRDLKEGVTTLVSVNTEGTQGNNGSYDPSVSDDGRFVAFLSRATNLVANDTNSVLDIFVHDRQTLTTTHVSVSSGGVEGNSYCFSPTISANGRYVAFESDSNNLVDGDTNNRRDVFVHDRNTGLTTRASVDSAGGQSVGESDRRYISANGRYVAFSSSGINLLPGDSLAEGIFVHDRNTGATTPVSVNSAGDQANGYSQSPAISANGRYVTFRSDAKNLVAGATTQVVVRGSDFLPGTGLAVDDATVSNLILWNENVISANITVSTNHAPGA